MNRGNIREAKIIGGRLKGQTAYIEGTIDEVNGVPTDLPTLAAGGNWAALNALEVDKYTIKDAPFYYGHVGSLGYIIAEKDLQFEENL